MLEITEKQWNNVKELYQSKLYEIKKLEEHIQYIEIDRERLVSERISKHNENIKLSEENTKLKKEIARQEHTMSAVLEKLNTSLNMLEHYGLKSKCKRTKITSDNLLDEVV